MPNQLALKLFGYEGVEEIIGKNALDFIASGDRPRALEDMRKMLETGQIGNIEYPMIKKDDTLFTAELTGSLVMDSKGKPKAVIGISRDITERKQAEEELRSSREQLRALSSHLQSIREEDRTQIAREIHDELGQALTVFKMDLSWLEKRIPKKEKLLVKKTQSLLKLIDTTIQSVRKISTKLRPGVLDDLGIFAAIEWQTEDFQDRTGIKCEFNSSLEDVELDRDCSTAVFRIFQETLTNVARHANATRVNISLKEDNSNLILEVKDNGRGITEIEVSDLKSLGLLGMRERALLFGGEVKISGIQGKGTTVAVTIPIKKEQKTESRMQ